MPDPSSTSFPFHTYCVFIVPAVKAPVGGVVNHHGPVSPLVKLVCLGARGCVWCSSRCFHSDTTEPCSGFGVFTAHYLVSASAKGL